MKNLERMEGHRFVEVAGRGRGGLELNGGEGRLLMDVEEQALIFKGPQR